jgi:hypothetical protein
MDDLLKEAIADAKAVRETALENAKMALEEAFTPRLQNMLSQKIQTEMEDEDEKDVDEISYKEDDEDPSDDDVDEISYKEDDEDPSEMSMKDDDEDPSDVDETKIIEIDGVKYAPVVSEMEDEDEDEMDEIAKDDDEDMEEDLDLESVIKELESELDEAEEDDDEKEEMDENDVSSDIGKGDNKVNKKANDSTGVGSDGKAKLKETAEKDDDEVDEDIDLDEVLKALSEEEDEDEEKNEVAKLQSDLDEHRSVIETLRGKLNEVNLLNAKLLFTNKLFRKHGLNNEQKMKVVEQFDRASNLREVKLVYSTLGESFGAARKNEINEHKGSASKPIASTKSEKKVISESTDLRDRFKKLANLI